MERGDMDGVQLWRRRASLVFKDEKVLKEA